MARKKAKNEIMNEEFKSSFGVNASVPEPYAKGKQVHLPIDNKDPGEPMGHLDDKDSGLDEDDSNPNAPTVKHESLVTKSGMMNEIMKVLRDSNRDEVKQVYSSIMEDEDKEDEDLVQEEDFEQPEEKELDEASLADDAWLFEDEEPELRSEEDQIEEQFFAEEDDKEDEESEDEDDDDEDEKEDDSEEDDDDDDEEIGKGPKDKIETNENMDKAAKTEAYKIGKDDLIMEYDISKVFEGGKFSKQFKNKVTSMFESAVLANVNANLESIQRQAIREARKEAKQMKEGLVKKLDSYLGYVAENFIAENQIAIENGLRMQVYESFITDLKGLFEKHYISVPEKKIDLVDALSEKLEKTENELNEEINRNIKLSEEVENLKKHLVIEDVAGDLPDSHKAKLSTLAESVEFVSEADFRDRLYDLKETFITEPKRTVKKKQVFVEDHFGNDYDGVVEVPADNSPLMEAAIQKINKLARK